MNKKGFTLIEVFAVVVILGLLFAIISPTVVNLLDDSEDALHDEQINMVITAAKKYMIEHSEYLPEVSDSSIVYIEDLINSGIIDNDTVIDPKSKEELNGCVVVNYNNDFNQYEYNYEDDYDNCLINVTFDPEDGSVDITSKQVRYNSTYGDLPTPTREGYTFKGWRGKNMFDEETILMAITGATKENGYYLFTNTQAHESYGGITGDSYVGNKQMNIVFDDNTQYTFSFSGHTNYLEDLNRYPNFYFGYLYDSGRKMATLASTDDIKKQITSDMPNNVRYISFSYGVRGTVYIHNVQLEKGNTATEYEPYQEYNSDTIVTKPSDHVLHAIWEVAS